MKVALYSCNFGNYRNELRGFDSITFDKNIDYYFFTDNTTLTSKTWKIIQYPLLEGDDTMDGNRWTSKQVKFVLPEILSGYDVVVWCDSKILKPPFKLTKEQIVQLFTDSQYKMVNVKHPKRKTLQEELQYTLEHKVENVKSGNMFMNEIKHIKYETYLPETCFIIRKTDTETNALFESVYNLLRTKKLKRDQNVYTHAIHEMNYAPENIMWIRYEFVVIDPSKNPP